MSVNYMHVVVYVSDSSVFIENKALYHHFLLCLIVRVKTFDLEVSVILNHFSNVWKSREFKIGF